MFVNQMEKGLRKWFTKVTIDTMASTDTMAYLRHKDLTDTMTT